MSTRELLGELVEARGAGSPEDAARLLDADVRYWDCVHGDVEGREAVAAALTAPAGRDARLEVETVAAGNEDAVVELQVSAAGEDGRSSFRRTEVYSVREGRILSCRAYFDPRAVPAA